MFIKKNKARDRVEISDDYSFTNRADMIALGGLAFLTGVNALNYPVNVASLVSLGICATVSFSDIIHRSKENKNYTKKEESRDLVHNIGSTAMGGSLGLFFTGNPELAILGFIGFVGGNVIYSSHSPENIINQDSVQSPQED